MSKKRIVVLMITMLFLLSGCSEGSTSYRNIKRTYADEKWKETIDLINEFKINFPEDRHIEDVEEISKDCQYQLNLKKAKELLMNMNNLKENKDWKQMIKIGNEIMNLVPNDEITAEVKKMMNEAQNELDKIELTQLYNDLQIAYKEEKWENVINIAMKITTKYINTNEAKIATNYSSIASKKIIEINNKKLKSLLKKFDKQVDSVEGYTYYMPDSIPQYVNDRCSFAIYLGQNSTQTWLRWRLSYTGDDWVFFKRVIINVDGKKYTKVFNYSNEITRDNKYGDVWEVADVNPTDLDLEWIKKVSNSKKTIVRFEGNNKYYDYTVTSNDKQEIKNIFNAYELMK